MVLMNNMLDILDRGDTTMSTKIPWCIISTKFSTPIHG